MCMKSVPVVLDDLREWVDAMLSTTFSRVGLGQIGIVVLPCIDTLSGALEPLLSTMSEIVIAHYEVLRWYKKKSHNHYFKEIEFESQFSQRC